MIADAQPCDRATAACLEYVKLLVGVVQRVEERAIGRRPQPRDRRLILDRAVQCVADARFLPTFAALFCRRLPAGALAKAGRSLGPQALLTARWALGPQALPPIEDLDVAVFVARAVRHVDTVALRRECETAPRLLHL